MDNAASSSTRIAVLIDCENVSAKHIGAVLEELASHGVPTVKRAYGDWTTTQLTSWKPELLRNAIQPVQQFSNTIGKNSTDSALIIDAMDLLWQNNVEAFAIVSSDSDFTRLATRLRESGKRVLGLGHRKTPESLRRAVDQFIFLEVLQEQDRQDTEQVAAASTSAAAGDGGGASSGGGGAADDAPTINLQSALTKAINATSADDGWSTFSQVGQHLSRAHADFDPRDFGHQKLSTLIDEQPYLDTRSEGSHRLVRLRQKRATQKAAVTRQAATKQPAAQPFTQQPPSQEEPDAPAPAKRTAAKRTTKGPARRATTAATTT